MILLTLDTGNFYFQALGETQMQAKRSLDAATRYHAEQYNLPRNWTRDYEMRATIFNVGDCLRDGQLLFRQRKA